MRISLKIIIVLFMFSLTACESWLDIKPEMEATEGQVFSSPEGYHSVLNGLYKAMGKASLYGTELSFGVVDCMSQQYALDLGTSVTSLQRYVDAGNFKYTSDRLNPTIDEMWKSAFNVVANANNLIQNITNQSPDFFKEGRKEMNMIMGEAYACRALMHFDLLRLFAPAPVNDDGRAYVPYVEQYPNIQANTIPVKPFLDKVIKDIELARTLVMEFDTSAIGTALQITGKSRFNDEYSYGSAVYGTPLRGFFKGRGYRLNYYSITALLARVYQYAGRDEDAFNSAKAVVDLQVKDYYGLQKAFGVDDFSGIRNTNLDSKRDLKVISNLIFAIHNEKAYDELNLENFFKREFYSGTVPTWLVINRDVQKTFFTKEGIDEAGKDYRSTSMIFLAMNSSGQYPISAKWFISSDVALRNKNLSILPVIRATEMRYIMAEHYARQGNFGEAKNVLTDIRTKRGCTENISITTWPEFVEELVRDARREWISEGQLFYLYKRLNANVNFGKNVIRPLQRNEYLLPVPSNQSL